MAKKKKLKKNRTKKKREATGFITKLSKLFQSEPTDIGKANLKTMQWPMEK